MIKMMLTLLALLAAVLAKVGELPSFLTPLELAKLLRTSPETLAQDRHNRRGIPFLKLGRKVLYERAVVEAYLRENTQKTGA